LELIKDYDLEVHCHPKKANVMADALSGKTYANGLQMTFMPAKLCAEMEHLNLNFVTNAMELG
jgi:hypothetical protein